MLDGSAPLVGESTVEERRQWVSDRYPCIADCDACGLCTLFHGKDASTALAGYIKGNEEFLEAMEPYRRR